MEQRFTFTDAHGPRKGGGFFHESTLKDNQTGMEWTGRVNYENRTWEPHSFYTSRRCALSWAVAYFQEQAVKKALEIRSKLPVEPVKRVTKEYREKAIEFYGDGVALALLSGIKC